MNSTDPTKALDLNELIYLGKNGELNPATSYYVNRIDNMIIPTSSVFESYMDFLIPLTVVVRLNEEEYYRYIYRPKLLSKDIYNTVELSQLLLRLNRLQSSMDFTLREVRILLPEHLQTLNKIFIMNKDALQASRDRITY